MGRQVVKKRAAVSKKAGKVDWKFPLGKKNLMVVGIGVGTVLLGYALMSTSVGAELAHENTKWDNPLAITVAPIVLAIGYCILIPLGLIRNFEPKKVETEEANAEN